MKPMMIKSLKLLVAATIVGSSLPLGNAHAGSDPFIGEIGIFGMNFCPRGWTEANGQLLPISRYEALFSLMGATYGGDGRTTFALPDLRGRTPVNHGKGPGLEERVQGQTNDPKVIEYAGGNNKARAEAPHIVMRYCIALQGIYPSRN